MERAHPGYTYTPLEGTQIRLVKFAKSTSPRWDVGQTKETSCAITETASPHPGGHDTTHGTVTLPCEPPFVELEIQTFDINSAPPYFALSYVWGDPLHTRNILMNGHSSFDITANLCDALVYIHQLSCVLQQGMEHALEEKQAELFLWIDAICINQNDTHERSKQVLRMSEIYPRAFTTLVWLGTFGTDQSNSGLSSFICWSAREFPLPGQARDEEKYDHGPEVEELDSAGVLDLLQTFTSVLLLPWFTRTWTVQEYALSAREPIALLGGHAFALESLKEFADVVVQHIIDSEARHNLPQRVYALSSAAARAKFMATRAFGMNFMSVILAARHFRAMSVAWQLLELLMSLENKQSSILSDRIYGILGLVDTKHLPQPLLPDYLQEYDEVCQRYCRYIIEETGNLQLLTFERPPAFVHRPSWVMDFRSLSHYCHEPMVPSRISFIRDGNGLMVQGCKLNTVIAHLVALGDVEDRIMLARLHAFHDDFLAAAALAQNVVLINIWQQWLTNYLSQEQRIGGMAGLRADLNGAKDAKDLLRLWQSTRTDWSFELRVFLSKLADEEFLLLDDGTFDEARTRTKQDGTSSEPLELWALKGAIQPLILKKASNADHYRYMGRLLSGPVELGSDFFFGRQLETVVLM
jgi:hypothetical protein